MELTKDFFPGAIFQIHSRYFAIREIFLAIDLAENILKPYVLRVVRIISYWRQSEAFNKSAKRTINFVFKILLFNYTY